MTTMEPSSTNLQQMFAKVMNDDNEQLRGVLESSNLQVGPGGMDFVRNIANYSRDKLARERNILRADLDVLHRSMESDILVSDRSVEPSVESIDVTLKHEVKQIREDLKSLTLALPSETSSLHSFREEKQRIKCLVSNLDQVTEFLEIPQLMEQCVNAKQFGEALSMYDYFHRITKKYGLADNKLVATLRSQLDTIRNSLVAEIERALSSQNLKVQEVNNLLLIYRLMFPRENLKVKFLEFRFKYYFHRKEVAVLAAVSPAKAAKDFIELLRVQLTDIVNQFKALFPTESDNSIELSRFVLSEVNDFFRVFEESFRVMPADQLFSQIADMYKMLVFVKHFHLNSKVNHIVHSVLSQRIELACADTVEAFKKEIAMYNWKPFLSLIPDGGDHKHIIQLTRNKPSAVLYNDITSIINDLRQFPMWSLRETVVQLIDQTLLQCLEILSNTSTTSDEMQSMRSGFCSIIVPMTEKNLGTIFAFNPIFQNVRSHPRFLHVEEDDQRNGPEIQASRGPDESAASASPTSIDTPQ